MRWFVTDLDRLFVKVKTSERDATFEARTSISVSKAFDKARGFYEFRNKNTGRTLYVLREDKLKQYGFQDLLSRGRD